MISTEDKNSLRFLLQKFYTAYCWCLSFIRAISSALQHSQSIVLQDAFSCQP